MRKLATVGCGYFSQFHHAAWQQLAVNRAAVCDLDPARAAAFAARYGFEHSFDDFTTMLGEIEPDLVDIILPPEQHLDHIRLAAQRGVDVICQKPFTENLRQANEAVQIAADAGIVLVVHENFRFQPWYRKIRALLDQDRLGEIYQLRFQLRPGDGQGADAYLDRQPYFQQMPRFLIRETGIHFIDVFRFLLGEPRSVYADLRQLNAAIRGEDSGLFVFDFGASRQAVFDGNRLIDHVAKNRRLTMGEMTVEGARATLRLDGDGRLWLRDHGSNDERPIEIEMDADSFGGGCVHALQSHVLECLDRGVEAENTAASYLRNLELQEAIYRSDEKGTRLDI